MSLNRRIRQLANFIQNMDELRDENFGAAQAYQDEIETPLHCDPETAKTNGDFYALNAGILELAHHFIVEGLKSDMIQAEDINKHIVAAADLSPAQVLRDVTPEKRLLTAAETPHLQHVLHKYFDTILIDLSEDYIEKRLETDMMDLPHRKWLSSVALAQSLVADAYGRGVVSPAFEQKIVYTAYNAIANMNDDESNPIDSAVLSLAMMPMANHFAKNKIDQTASDYVDLRTMHIANFSYLDNTILKGLGNLPSLS